MQWHPWLVPAALALAGCDPCGSTAAPSLTFGTGEDAWQDLDPDGGEVELVHGPQGAYHVAFQLRATGLEATEFGGARIVGDAATGPDTDLDTFTPLRCQPGLGVSATDVLLLIWPGTIDPQRLDRDALSVEATLTDGAGQQVSGTAELVIEDPNF